MNLSTLLRRRFCRHAFAIDDLSLTGDLNEKRVKWPCSKCGKVFYVRCGLDVSKHGPIFRRANEVKAA